MAFDVDVVWQRLSQRGLDLLFRIGRAPFQFIVGFLESVELFPRQDLPGIPKLDK